MSNIYATEPVTRAKVVLTTTVGDIDIELWTLEAKKACRNFIQLCLEGYYDNTIFHRVVKDFIVQGGDPTGTGTGGESIYGEPFADEIHSRLRFSHRGIVAMANTERNTNQSQFFITLAATPELNGKNTIFGKVVGDTIFNVLRMNEFPVDEDDRPLFPPKILSTEVLLNPFDDILPREIKKPQQTESKEEAKPKKIPAAKRDMKVLSFGEDEEEEAAPTFKKPRMKSSHFFEEDPDGQAAVPPLPQEEKSPSTTTTTTTTTTPTSEATTPKQTTTSTHSTAATPTDADTSEESAVGRKDRPGHKRKRSGVISAKKTWNVTNDGEADDGASMPTIVTEEDKKKKQREEMKREQEELKKSILALKKNQAEEEKKVTEEVQLTPLQEQQQKYKRRGKKDPKQREQEAFLKLQQFTASLRKGDADWKGHQLKCPKPAGVIEEEELYSVFDPLLNKKSAKPTMSLHKKRLTQTGEVERW